MKHAWGLHTPRDPSPKTSNVYHHGDLKEAILGVAMRQVEEEGPEGISVRAITRILGVSGGAPYGHFRDREALLSAVAMRGFEGFSATLVAAAKDGSACTPLARIAHAYMKFALDYRQVYRLLFATPLLKRASVDSALHQAAYACLQVLLSTMSPRLDEAVRLRAAFRFWTSLHGLAVVDQCLLSNDARVFNLVDVVDDLVRDFERGLSTGDMDAVET
ncbi:MAG TPA: TetR/AcrR family transcriptional regulator [Caulobacter sp.]|nr:TetR/AcrR family transcriptional regulator [Caulobacter sp.]